TKGPRPKTKDQRPKTKDQRQRPKTQDPRPMQYIELHARSAFSFLEGASVPEELIAACLEFDMPAMVLLDRNGVYGAPRFHLAAKKNGIKAHIGAEINVQSPTSKVKNQGSFSLPVLVRTRTGYQNLCRLITKMKLRVPKHAKPSAHVVTMSELQSHADGLICLTGDSDGPLSMQNVEEMQQHIEWLGETFGKENVYAELQRHLTRDEEARNQVV